MVDGPDITAVVGVDESDALLRLSLASRSGKLVVDDALRAFVGGRRHSLPPLLRFVVDISVAESRR